MCAMTALEIIEEIKQLPPGEKVQVLHFVRALGDGGKLTGGELNELSARLAEEESPAMAEGLKERIATGFYGTGSDA